MFYYPSYLCVCHEEWMILSIVDIYNYMDDDAVHDTKHEKEISRNFSLLDQGSD